MADLTELQRLAEGATPGPWHGCKQGACSCSMVWCGDYPVATVTRGKWGDTFPSLRLVGEPSLIGRQVEPYIEMIEYGEVPEDRAQANAAYIAAMSPDTAKKLIAVALAAQKALAALEEAQTYTASPSWSPSMTLECKDAEVGLRTALEELK